MPLLEQHTPSEFEQAPLEASVEPRQRRQMLIALALLLVALILVLIKDRQFWFPSSSSDQSELMDPTRPDPATLPHPQTANPPAAPAAHPKARQRVPNGGAPVQELAPPAVTNRAILPPLEVQVVAGDQHQTVQTTNPSVRVDLQTGSPPLGPSGALPAAGPLNPTTSTAVGACSAFQERQKWSPRPVEPNYPMLAKQMKVQGSVVLDALIGRDGNIQDLQVVSGPAILSAAAREAVKQWRFKPYYQGGQALETEARITVNFTISTQ